MGTRGRKPEAVKEPTTGWMPLHYPRGLNGAEKEYWDEFMSYPSASLLDGNDVPVLRALCEALVMHDRIRNELKEAPLTVKGFGGSVRMNPLTEEAHKLRNQIKQLAYSLGFSPTSRRGAQAPARAAKVDPDEEFLQSL